MAAHNIGMARLKELLEIVEPEKSLEDLDFNKKISELQYTIIKYCSDQHSRDLFDNVYSNNSPQDYSGNEYPYGDDINFARCSEYPPDYIEGASFVLKRIAVNINDETYVIPISETIPTASSPVYSVIIGRNGIGKSSMLRAIVDFFIDLRSSIESTKKPRINASKLFFSIEGLDYIIDGIDCQVVKVNGEYLSTMDNALRALKYLRFPSIVACHFGAFNKFPTQTMTDDVKTKYDVDHYKYVGSYVNGNMISIPLIIFRLLFSLCNNLNENNSVCTKSVFEVIGYDARVLLTYNFGKNTFKGSRFSTTSVKNKITQYLSGKTHFKSLGQKEKIKVINEYVDSYTTLSQREGIEVIFSTNNDLIQTGKEIKQLYKLRQMGLVSQFSAFFYKQGERIPVEELSTGELCMISTILNISATANGHTLIMLDEPELSLHPNWQMEIIDNLEKTLHGKTCHLLIATHSNLIVSDLPMDRSNVIQLKREERSKMVANVIPHSTYGWSAEEILIKVFGTATDRNRYFSDLINSFLHKISNNEIDKDEADKNLEYIKNVGQHLNKLDPMRKIVETIIDVYD